MCSNFCCGLVKFIGTCVPRCCINKLRGVKPRSPMRSVVLRTIQIVKCRSTLKESLVGRNDRSVAISSARCDVFLYLKFAPRNTLKMSLRRVLQFERGLLLVFHGRCALQTAHAEAWFECAVQIWLHVSWISAFVYAESFYRSTASRILVAYDAEWNEGNFVRCFMKVYWNGTSFYLIDIPGGSQIMIILSVFPLLLKKLLFSRAINFLERVFFLSTQNYIESTSIHSSSFENKSLV